MRGNRNKIIEIKKEVRFILYELCKMVKKIKCISAYTQPTHFIFGRVIDIVSIFYHTKDQVRGLCVGGDMAILFVCPFAEFTQNGRERKKALLLIQLLLYYCFTVVWFI